MPKKIAFIGAGSIVFTRNLVRDILTFPAFEDAVIALMDIDSERLKMITKVVHSIIKNGGYTGAKVIATQDRIEALKDADGVVCTILAHGPAVWHKDISIPMEYGVNTNCGDTRGPSGIFRFLRTAPISLGILREIEQVCPQAIFLNYTNPMAMLCRMMQEKAPQISTTGLCHSVQGTAEMLARWIGAPKEEITYRCAGINHQAFYLNYEWNGKDAYPLIHDAVSGREEIYNEEQVRNEMYLALDYYPTESSGHNSEYNAWFRKRPDLIEKYCTHGTGWNPGKYLFGILDPDAPPALSWQEALQKSLDEPFPLERSHEYAAYIFNACFGDGSLFEFNGNVRNDGLIDNLPEGCCVEVPCLASGRGFSPMHVGKLPPQLAALIGVNAQVEEMAVAASLAGDPRLVYQAICHDPLTAAVCSLREIDEMVRKMFAFNAPYLPQFKHLN